MQKQSLMLRLRHWWQRNFGHVYVLDSIQDKCFRVGTRFGCVAAFCPLGFPFPLRLGANGELLNTKEWMFSYNKPIRPEWTWSYTPQKSDFEKGGFL